MNETPVRIVTNSELGEYRECKRKWWIHNVRRLRLKPEYQKQGAASLGSLIHNAFEQDDLGKITWQQYIDGSEIADLYKNLDGEKFKKSQHHHKMARVMIEGYFLWLEQTGADQWYEVIDVERKVDVQLFPGVKLRGKIDKLLRHREYGYLVFLDYKSLADFRTILRKAAIDEQFLMYLLLLRAENYDDEVRSGIWRMLKKGMQTDRSLNEDGSEKEFYSEHEQRFVHQQLETFLRRVQGITRNILDDERRLAEGEDHHYVAYPTPNNECWWKCEFYAVCPSFDDGSRVEDMLDEMYEHGDPLARYGEEPEEEDD